MDELMAGSNYFGIGLGTKKLKVIIKEYPDIVKTKLSNEEITENIKKIEGFDDITAKRFADNLPHFVKFLKELEKKIDLNHLYQDSKKGNNLKGEIIVFTGFRNSELEKLVE